MAQPLITQFYNKRKRAAEGITIDVKSKVLVLDGESKSTVSEDSTGFAEFECRNGTKMISYHIKNELYENVTISQSPINTPSISETQNGGAGKSPEMMKISKKTRAKTIKSKVGSQPNNSDIRLAFKPKILNNESTKISEMSDVHGNSVNNTEKLNAEKKEAPGLENKVVFELLGGLSPRKRSSKEQDSPIKQEYSNQEICVKNARRELGLMTPKKITEQTSKATSLGELRTKLNRSSRLAEIRESIKRFNKSDQVLKDLDDKKKKLDCLSPQLKKFTSIGLEVPVSPQKVSSVTASVSSPDKGSPFKRTPLKSPLTSPVKNPAYQRLAHLVQPGVPTLALPYTYRMLAEIFRSVDTVMSMMYNRKETVTFEKLKAGVQQMLRRNFTEQHLGQIKKVLPTAFEFSQEKCSSNMSSKKGRYELVIVPVIDSKKTDVSRIINGSCHSVMTPSVLVERRELFHKSLLEIVKDCHAEFLKNLEPPVVIPRSTLARWHPDFDLERVPQIIPADLPAVPVEEKVCSAQDVLDRAKTLFGCNARMEKALEMIGEKMKKSEESNLSQTSNNSDSNSSLLKGIPKALLEKVRAKQAAKALLAMTRTPAEDREAMQLLRLPEIARILRNIYVAEKKSVLPLDIALEKLSNSYRESLSCGELEQHIRLLMKVVPGWVDILHVRKTDYVKVVKDADISAVMRKLEKLAENKSKL